MPVLAPCLASIETQNAVLNGVVFWLTIERQARAGRADRPSSAMQIRPRPCLAMKLIASGVIFCRRNRQVALVLAVLVVDDDDHAARADGFDRLLDRGERAACGRAMRIFGFFVVISILASTATSSRRGGFFELRAPCLARRGTRCAARATYFPTMSHSRLTRSRAAQRVQIRVLPGKRDDHHVEFAVPQGGDRSG